MIMSTVACGFFLGGHEQGLEQDNILLGFYDQSPSTQALKVIRLVTDTCH